MSKAHNPEILEKLSIGWLAILAVGWILILIFDNPDPAKMFTGHGSRYANPTDPGMQCSARWFEWINHTSAWGVSPGIQAWVEESTAKRRNQ